MITVHHLERSRSSRILWLFEELGAPYEIKTYARDPKTNLGPPELAKIHPLGKAPIVTDGDAVLAETAAIIEHYLDADPQARLRPAQDDADRGRHVYWMHYAEGSAMALMLLRVVATSVSKRRAPPVIQSIVRQVGARLNADFVDPRLRQHIAFWETSLGEAPWFGGRAFTAADIMMSTPVEGSTRFAEPPPNVAAWLERIQARPAYQAAREKGGPGVGGR